MRLLSTKVLDLNLKSQIAQIGISVFDYPFIKINSIPLKNFKFQSSFIFSSQNAVKIAFKNPQIKKHIGGKRYFCVGEKTKALLEKNGQKVIKMSHNASDLGFHIIKAYKDETFSFFCGKLRRPEIESLLVQEKISLQIHEIYNTIYHSKKFDKQFDGVLFFSPSAVNSFFKKNNWSSKIHGFSIGKSTSKTLKKFTKDFTEAKKPNENELLSILNSHYLKHYA